MIMSKRFWIYWIAIAGMIHAPNLVVDWVGRDRWMALFCYTPPWYQNFDSVLGVIVPSLLHHQFWLGRYKSRTGKEALALTLVIHGWIIFPALLIFWWIGMPWVFPDLIGHTAIRWISLTLSAYVLLFSILLSYLECLWPTDQLQRPINRKKRIGLVVSLSSATIFLAVFFIGADGQCLSISMP